MAKYKAQVSRNKRRGSYLKTKRYERQYREFLSKLRGARIDAGLSQTAAAKRLGKPQTFISKIELGERRVDVVELHHIAKVYKKPLSFFEPSS